jgi:hypothetical protein
MSLCEFEFLLGALGVQIAESGASVRPVRRRTYCVSGEDSGQRRLAVL